MWYTARDKETNHITKETANYALALIMSEDERTKVYDADNCEVKYNDTLSVNSDNGSKPVRPANTPYKFSKGYTDCQFCGYTFKAAGSTPDNVRVELRVTEDKKEFCAFIQE